MSEDIVKLMDEDPQRLVDEQILFRFDGVDGEVKLIDGWAAGGSWLEFEFVAGPFAGRKVWCSDNNDDPGLARSFTYLSCECDDGFFFNPDPSKEPECSGRHGKNVDVVSGGGFYPEWHGRTFVIAEER